ncbi:MAG: site-specific integrase [Pirellulales bacterium]
MANLGAFFGSSKPLRGSCADVSVADDRWVFQRLFRRHFEELFHRSNHPPTPCSSLFLSRRIGELWLDTFSRSFSYVEKTKKPQCPFIQRFSEDLRLTGKSERTIQSYCRNIRKLSEHLGHDPNQAAEEDIRKYLLYITEEKQWSSSTVNVALQAMKVYYRVTCPRDWAILKLARVKVEQKLPIVAYTV